MKNNTNNFWKLICIILIIIVVILLGSILKNNIGKEETKDNTTSKTKTSQNNVKSNEEIEENIRIMLDEDLSKNGNIEGLENVSWNNVRIRQADDEMEVSITLSNELYEETIPSKDLTINLLDKDKKVICTKDLKMEEIPNQHGMTMLEFTTKITEQVLIHDVQIKAK